jgi:hypothetical protein
MPAWPSTPTGRGHQVLAAARLVGLARGEGLAGVRHRVQEAPGVVRDTRRRLAVPGTRAGLESLSSAFPSVSWVPDVGQGSRWPERQPRAQRVSWAALPSRRT